MVNTKEVRERITEMAVELLDYVDGLYPITSGELLQIAQIIAYADNLIVRAENVRDIEHSRELLARAYAAADKRQEDKGSKCNGNN